MDTGMDRAVTRANLARLLSPTTLAVVGANERLGMSNNAVLPMLEAGRDVALVNPRHDVLYDRPAVPDLAAICEPVDAVLSLVNAERAIGVVEDAAALGCGGVVVVAAGFVEAGAEGAALQARLVDAAARSGIAVIGPNCAGFKNVPLGVNLFTGGRLDVPVSGLATVGGVGIVSQSGFLVRSALAAAQERALGVSIAVSSGNEAVCDLADHVSVLAADPLTSVICLVIETVRRPDAFFAAVGEARAAGKPVIALKLGRSDRARRIMQSHTGAIADESWVYDLAFREHGVVPARDIDDLLDRAQLFVQLPPERRRRIERIGMITTSGGVAALATDLADDVGAPLPPLPEIEAWVRERVPGDTVNPLDLTGFAGTKPELMADVFEQYARAVDVVVLAWWTGAQDAGWSRTLLGPFAEVAARCDIPFVVCPVEATGVGAWVTEWRSRGLSFARGVESLYRAVDALDRFLAPARGAPADVSPAASAPPACLVASEVGPMVRFADAMRLLTDAGIAVAPWLVVEGDAEVDPAAVAALGDPLVVKLADVPHRTEIGAVRVGVDPSDVPTVLKEMRAIAAAHDASPTVAVQAMAAGHAEAFGGLQCRTGLGPVVLLGLGGVLVEVTRQVGGRFLPVDDVAAAELAEEVAGPAGRLRGQAPWPIDAVAGVVRGLDRLWHRHGAWIDSLDVNPIIVGDEGVVAVDALMIARP
ncbi:MAG TPA: acetate--CoA ligase family protein [Ornithinibacter sp.]|nr:acetate--CoA ligase family protein [Ornithinibacter sp.]